MTRKSRAATVFIIVGIALVAVWLLREEGDPTRDGGDRRSALPEAPAARGIASQQEGDAATGTRPIATEPFARESATPEEDGVERCSVLVIDRQDRPVAGAEVFFEFHRWKDPATTPPLALPLPETPVRIAKTDRDGFAWVPTLSKPGVMIHARTREASGCTVWSPHPEVRRHLESSARADAVIVLDPIRVLEIQVLDHLGAPAPSVYVDVLPPYPPYWKLHSVLLGPAMRGICELRTPHPDAVLSVPLRSDHPHTPYPKRGIPDLYEAETAVIMVPLPGRDRLTRRVPLEPEGRTRVTLNLPPTVLVDLEIREPGSPERISCPVHVTWAAVEKSESGRPRFWSAMREFLAVDRSFSGTLAVDNGRCSIGGFAPGFELGLAVRAKGRVPTTKEVVLPSTGNRAKIILQAGAPLAHLEARLLELEGVPARHLRLRTRVLAGHSENLSFRDCILDPDRRSTVESDAEGRIRMAVPPGLTGTVELRDSSGPRGQPATATLPLPVLQPREVRDLGDLLLPGRSLLVSGIVVAGEEPQAGITVEAKPKRESRTSSKRPRLFHGAISTRTDSHGRFSLHGPDQATGELEILARSPGSRSKPIWAAVGSKDVRIALEELGSVSGSVRLVDPSIPTLAHLALRTPGSLETSHGSSISSERISPDSPDAGVFQISRVSPGTYDLEVTIHGFEAARIAGLEVKPGEHSAPPLLQRLEVDAVRARVEVRDPAGNPLPGISVGFRKSGGRSGITHSRRTDARGISELVVPRRAPITVEVGRRRRGLTSQVSVPDATFPLVVTLEQPPK